MQPLEPKPDPTPFARCRAGREPRFALCLARGVLACAVLTGCTAASAEWGLDASAGLTGDDNLTNAFQSDDRKADTAAIATLEAGIHEQVGAGTGVGLGLVLSGARYFRYEGLDNLGLGARARLRSKFGLGESAPWVALAAHAVHRDYRDDARDGWEYEAAATLGRQLTDRWSLRGTIRYDAYKADSAHAAGIAGLSAAAYDIDGWSVGANAGFRLTEADLLSAGVSCRDGSVTTMTHPDEEVLEYSDAAVVDGAFSGATSVIAYRVAAITRIANLTWSHALGKSAALNVSYSYRASRADHGLGTYVSNVLVVSLGYRY
jgi:hypothetical protein